MCPQLSNPANGLVRFSTLEMDFPPFELGTTATYVCNSGFGLTPSGVDPIRLCESDDDSLNGVWTGQELFCSGDDYNMRIKFVLACDFNTVLSTYRSHHNYGFTLYSKAVYYFHAYFSCPV